MIPPDLPPERYGDVFGDAKTCTELQVRVEELEAIIKGLELDLWCSYKTNERILRMKPGDTT